MSRPKLRAEFFVSLSGEIISKAKNLTYPQRKEIYERDSGKCVFCGQDVEFYGGAKVHPYQKKTPSAIDHIFPKSRGGCNKPKNLRLLCWTCNSKRNAVWII